MDRRGFLLQGVTLLGGTAFLSGCGTNSTGQPTLPALPITLPANVSTLIDDATSIYNKVSSLSPSLPSSATSFLDKLRAGASSVASSTVVQDAQSGLSLMSSAWAALKPFLPTSASQIASAVDTVLPVALKVAGLVSSFAREVPTGLTVDQARAILRS